MKCKFFRSKVFIYKSVVSKLRLLISITNCSKYFLCVCKWPTAHLNKDFTPAQKYQTFTN